MKTNLIQTYLNNVNTKKDRDLDIKYELSNRTFIKPLPAKGKLVNHSILEAPAIWAQDTAYDIKSFYETLRGKGNDHELGKVNDLSMKIGGLVIAGYLMTRKQTPLQKAMEIVGLGSFFGAMALWPKIALQMPARLIHGFNIRQEYEDSFGRKKMFFQDPQYIPWDLMNEEQINKIGDRMGVPEDIPNRRDFIQEKMRKTAIQNNTLWMMTAGFATPILSALICNLSEKPLTKFIDNIRDKNANNLLYSIDNIYTKHTNTQDINFIINKHTNKVISNEIINDITSNFVSEIDDDVITKTIQADIKNILKTDSNTYTINENVIEKLEKSASKILPKEISINFNEILKEYYEKELSEVDMKKVMNKLMSSMKNSIKNSYDEVQSKKIINNILNNSQKELSQALHSESLNTLTKEKAGILKEIAQKLGDFRAKKQILDEYIYLKAGAAPQTGVANIWNEITEKLHKLFDFSNKEISSVRYDRKLTGKLLRSKFEEITSDKLKYENVCKKLVEEINVLETRIQNLGVNGNYSKTVDRIFDMYASELKELGFTETADRIVGKNGVLNGSLKNIQKSYIQDRLIGVKSSLYRLLNTLDFYRRISSLKNISTLHNNIPTERIEEIVEFAKTVSIEGSTSDFMTKFYYLRNPKPSTSKEQIRVKHGKVQNRYLDNPVKGGKVDMPNDSQFFREIMRLLFEDKIHPDTTKIISDSLTKESFAEYRRAFAYELGDSEYFTKPYHNLHGKNNQVSSYIKFLRTGKAPDQLLNSVVKETYNTRKWLKMFGGFGAGLFAFTVLTQFFFGKMQINKGGKND